MMKEIWAYNSITAVFFDFGGTLFDYFPSTPKIWALLVWANFTDQQIIEHHNQILSGWFANLKNKSELEFEFVFKTQIRIQILLFRKMHKVVR